MRRRKKRQKRVIIHNSTIKYKHGKFEIEGSSRLTNQIIPWDFVIKKIQRIIQWVIGMAILYNISLEIPIII